MGSILSYFIVLSPITITNFSFKNTDLARDYPAVTVAAITKWLQSNHNYAFRDLWNC